VPLAGAAKPRSFFIAASCCVERERTALFAARIPRRPRVVGATMRHGRLRYECIIIMFTQKTAGRLLDGMHRGIF